MKKRILIICAHPDDEVLGCGGTIAKLTEQGHELRLLVLTDGESSRIDPAVDRKRKSLKASCEILGIASYEELSFEDSKLDACPIFDIVQEIEKMIKKFSPQVVYTHSPQDVNQDHQVAFKATLIACRPLPDSSIEQILTYEVPSSTDYGQAHSIPAFNPTVFEVLTDKHVATKMRALECYKDELRPFPHSRSRENIKALLTVRGCSVGSAAAEAFELQRMICK